MPSRSEPHACRRAAALLALALALALPTFAASNAAPDEAPDETQIAAAVEALKADPNLAAEQKIRSLRWARDNEPGKKLTLPDWFRTLFMWIAQSGRIIVWLVLAVLAGLLVLLIVRFVRAIGPRAAARKFDAPTHVQDLDIRPESLPDEVGAAALTLWRQAQHRSALSLLYRGLLSRLAHAHELPIKHSTTEGDCIDLAQQLDRARSDYVVQLVRVWQRAVYGGLEPQTEAVEQLCSGFAAALDVAPAQAAAT